MPRPRGKRHAIDAALLPISGAPGNFEIAEAAQLAEDIGARGEKVRGPQENPPALTHASGVPFT